MDLTLLETRVLNTIIYKGFNGSINNLGIKSKIAKGVVLSLVKKGLVEMKDDKVKLLEDKKSKNKRDKEQKNREQKNKDQNDKPAEETKDNTFTLNRLVKELDLDPKKARAALRKSNFVKKGKHWEWETEEEYKIVKELLSK
jgi:predicted phage gp36 major capsid-like protein